MDMVRRQATLNSPALCAGIALHAGVHVRLVLKPAEVGSGITFIRTDITDRDNVIQLSADAVTHVRQCTTIANDDGAYVATVEHLLAALASLGIDNLIVEVDGPELPALDGSAAPYLDLVERAGIRRQPAPRRYVKVLKPVETQLGESTIRIEPAPEQVLDVTIDFEDAAIGRQSFSFKPDTRTFRRDVASARTFARSHEVEALQAAGLGLGGSMENAVIVEGDKVLNPEGLRYADEFVRHKTLDLFGDLYVAGPILGHVTAYRAGHAVNHELLKAIFADSSNWEYVVLQDRDANPARASVRAEIHA